ncbi:MAG: rod shape-determining protein MreC [Acidobacteriia bacterium]|nr:rod shape-determining protein MreC [Terriglobia bacterium]
MAAIASRHRSLVLLAIAIVAQVLLLAVQIQQAQQGRHDRLIRVWTVAVISPFERAGAWGVGKVRSTWNHYFALRYAAQENDSLRGERDTLKMQINQLQGRAAEADRLVALLKFRQEHANAPLIAARVIGTSAEAASQTIYIDRGERDGVLANMGVITPDGVVGKVLEAYRNTSQVLLLTDKDSGVGAMLADSRLQSPVVGMGEPLLQMKYVSEDDAVNPGERVVTSGMDRIFPKDLPVGTVVDVKPGMPFKLVRVRPAAGLQRLEEVLVLQTLQPLDLRKEAEPEAAAPAKSRAGSAPAAAKP